MEKQEEWRPVVGYEGLYEVSNFGRVKSLPRNTTKGGILKPSPAGNSYLQVKLCKNGRKSMRRVHQLVMRAFVGKCPDGYEVDHIDWKPSNNMLENLSYQPKELNRGRHSPEWQKNQSEAMKKLAQDPEYLRKNAEAVRKARSKPVNQYTLDGEFVKTWSSATDAAKEFGINLSGISACCNGKRKKASGFIWRYA